jgi:hypothetical protein
MLWTRAMSIAGKFLKGDALKPCQLQQLQKINIVTTDQWLTSRMAIKSGFDRPI